MQTNGMQAKYAQARLWWISRTPQEKGAGLDVLGYRLTPTIYIDVPMPFCGVVDIVSIGLTGTHSFSKKVSLRVLRILRGFYRKANEKGWYIKHHKDRVTFIREGRLFDRHGSPVNDPKITGRG